MTPYVVTLYEETDAFAKQKDGEARTIQTSMTDDCRVLQQLLVHHPRHVLHLAAI